MIQPLITCSMVTRNRPLLAHRAIHCFMNQTYANKELLILDDGDIDYTPIIESFGKGTPINYHRLAPSSGRTLGELRNLSIEVGNGDIQVQWDDDEWYHPERMSMQYEALKASSAGAVALKWTLMHIDTPQFTQHMYRADSGLATPGTLMFKRSSVRYPALPRNEDGIFMRSIKNEVGLKVLGKQNSHLFVRCFHGTNTWDEPHFLRKLYRNPVDWPSYFVNKFLRREITQHRAFRLTKAEIDTANELKLYAMNTGEHSQYRSKVA